MASLSIVKRGVAVVNVAALAAPGDLFCDVALPGDAVKTASTFRVPSIREQRKRVRTQRLAFAITDVSVSPLTAAITEVDLEASEISSVSIRENRTSTKFGATVRLTDVDEVTCEFAVAAGDTVDVEVEVKETLKELGATARLLNTTTLRVEWDRALEDDETITVAYEVIDLDDVGDSLLEVLFRLQRVLGFQGENSIQDLQTYDGAGNPTGFRVRVFATEADTENATVKIDEGSALEDGELSRYQVVINWNAGANRPDSTIAVRTHLAPTPEIS